jgi:hypothetical protein
VGANVETTGAASTVSSAPGLHPRRSAAFAGVADSLADAGQRRAAAPQKAPFSEQKPALRVDLYSLNSIRT